AVLTAVLITARAPDREPRAADAAPTNAGPNGAGPNARGSNGAATGADGAGQMRLRISHSSG
ncbi:MAG: hypothetical protein WCA46_12995, partial [Actinocatenispora sp.]